VGKLIALEVNGTLRIAGVQSGAKKARTFATPPRCPPPPFDRALALAQPALRIIIAISRQTPILTYGVSTHTIHP
jgi:hypothetical protein